MESESSLPCSQQPATFTDPSWTAWSLNGIDRLPQNVGTKLPFDAAYNTKRKKI